MEEAEAAGSGVPVLSGFVGDSGLGAGDCVWGVPGSVLPAAVAGLPASGLGVPGAVCGRLVVAVIPMQAGAVWTLGADGLH